MANSQRTVLRLQHLMRLQHVDRARSGAQLGVGKGRRNDRDLWCVWVCARRVVAKVRAKGVAAKDGSPGG